MKRIYLFLVALVGLSSAVFFAARLNAQGPSAPAAGAPAAPARADPPRVAVFNVALLMKKFDKWQYYAITMENARVMAATELLKMRNEIVRMQEAAQQVTEVAKQTEWIKKIRDKQIAFEDKEKEFKDKLDADANKHLKELFQDVNLAVQGIVEANGYDIVFAYPEATTKEEADSQNYIDLKLRAQAAMPFYVSKRIDITQTMIDTLNFHRKAPAAIPPKLKMPDPKEFGLTTTGGGGGVTAPVSGGK